MSRVFQLLFFIIFLLPKKALAMHIAEGVIPFSQALLWFIALFVVLIPSFLKLSRTLKEHPEKKAVFAFATALVFLLSMLPIPVPFAGTCSHPVGVSLSVMLLGLAGGIVSGFIVLILQAFLLAHGGVSSLGANAFSMAVVGSLFAYLALSLLKRTSLPVFFVGFLMGLLSDWATYFTTAFQLSLALTGQEPFTAIFIKAILAFLPTQLPIGILEGLLAGSIASALAKRRKDLLTWEV
jgi:cobalt/nickel transport system permease protein